MSIRVQASTTFTMGLVIALASGSGIGSGAAEPVATEPERYALEHCMLEITPPVEVGRAEGHFWFASLHPVEGQDILCEVGVSDDKAQGKWPAALCLSRDGGASWRRVRDIECQGPVSTALGPRKILVMPYETWPPSPDDKRNAVADGTILTLSEGGAIATESAQVKFCGFPRDLADYHIGEVYLLTNGNILPLKDGRLFSTVYGKFAGDTKDSVWSVTSDDRGFTWQFQATVANGQELAGAPEGANESNTARLADDRLLCVYRTGVDYHKSYSSDEGATWTVPEPMDGVFRVEPQLVRLANGVLLLSGGRQGLFVWVCTDGEGKTWERINLAEHHNRHVQDKALHYADAFCEAKGVDPPQSTSYTGMAAVGPNEVLVCYDRLGNGWKGAPGPWGAFDAVFCVRLTVTPSGAQPEGETSMKKADSEVPLYIYELVNPGGTTSYDEAMAVGCLQGIINRDGPRLYVVSSAQTRPRYWLDVLTQDGQWLANREQVVVSGLDGLVKLAGDRLKGAVIWDPDVPATVNIATTIAGVRDGVVLSPELAAQCLPKWNLPVLEDLRGRFDGAESGSKKNDAYRSAIREYLEKGLCSPHFLCLFEDACSTRAAGDVAYVVTRDWAVMNRAFVFDLSPWGDETPKDDPGQPLGTDLDTYRMLLSETLEQSAGTCMTEMTGFFAFWKYSNIPGYSSKHEPVPTEWETVYLISPYNCYQNTISSHCYNQSLHSQAPLPKLKQRRPQSMDTVEDKAYLCFLMADYDSATPLYDFLPNHWADPNRGKLPLAWGINPNLIETYPDLIAYFYATATPNDRFTSDASCAGYFNPNRIEPKYLRLFVEHNQRFFRATDMSIAPMVLDWDAPTPAVKDAFAEFAPDGYATIVMDLHGTGGALPEPHVWKGMPVLELINNTCNFSNPKQTADAIYGAIVDRGNTKPGFYFFRIVWVPPSAVLDSLDIFRTEHPDTAIEVVDPYNFFALFKRHVQHAMATGSG